MLRKFNILTLKKPELRTAATRDKKRRTPTLKLPHYTLKN